MFMRVNELITELSFHGRKCTQDCSGHAAGYSWGMRHKGTGSCNSGSPSFSRGCEIANDQIKNNRIVKPRIRGDQERYIPARIAKKKSAGHPF